MLRLLGTLFGSSVGIAALIVLAGVPRLTPPMPANETDPADSAATPAPARPATAESAEPAVAAPAQTADPAPAAAAAAADAAPTPLPEPDVAVAPDPPAQSIHWYAFWSPFRSQLAANGFVTQLQRVTGLDYRVVTVKPGVYEVAFAYTDSAEIDAILAQISAATGLDLPES